MEKYILGQNITLVCGVTDYPEEQDYYSDSPTTIIGRGIGIKLVPKGEEGLCFVMSKKQLKGVIKGMKKVARELK